MHLGQLKLHLVKLACPLGGYQLSRLLTRDVPKVLMYHRFANTPENGGVTASIFRQQLEEIRKKFRVVRLADVIRTLRAGGDLPSHTVVLTIDDGYRDFYTIAYPLLKEFQFPATFFIATDFIDRLTWLWPDILTYALANSKEHPSSVCRALGIAASDSTSNEMAWEFLAERCLSVADDERHRLLRKLLDVSGCGRLPDAIPKEYEPMTWDQIREVHANGIEIGAHTRSHPNLASVAPDGLTEEIFGCKKRIEDEIGAPVESFCYPNGTPADFNENVKSVVRRSGFLGAVVAYADGEPATDVYALKRFSSGGDIYQFRKALYGVEYCSARVAAWRSWQRRSAARR